MANKGKPFSDNDAAYPRITFQTPGRTFDRLLKERSLSDLRETVRKKLGLGSGSVILFTQLRNGQLVDLEDEDDFDAFRTVAYEQRYANVQVVLAENSIVEDSVDAKSSTSSLPPGTECLNANSSAFVLGGTSPQKLVQKTEDGVEFNLETLTTKVSLTPPTPSVTARLKLSATPTRKTLIHIDTPEQRQRRLEKEEQKEKEAKAKASAEDRTRREKEEEEAKIQTSRPRVDDAADLRRMGRFATTASELSSQLPSKAAWSKGPTQTASAPSPRSQSPASTTQPQTSHSRRPSALGQGISITDGVSVPRNNVGAVKQGTAVAFGSPDDVQASAPLSNSPAPTPPVKSEGVKPPGTVPNTHTGNASVASRPATGLSISTSSTSAFSAQASTSSIPSATSPISKFDVRKLFQTPSNSSTLTETPSPTSPRLGAHPFAMHPPPPPMAAQMQPPVPWPGYYYTQTYPGWNWLPQMSPATQLFQNPSSQPSDPSTSTDTPSPATRLSSLPSQTPINQTSQPPSTQSSYTPFVPNARRQQPHQQQNTVIPLPVTETGWDKRPFSNNDPDLLDVVDTNVKALLNKLTIVEFDFISDQIIQWANRSEKQKNGRTLNLVIRLVYEKAIDDAVWSEMYARLCKKMMEQISPNVQDRSTRNSEGNPIAGGQLFRKYLFNICQEDFERDWFAKEATAAAAATNAAEEQVIKVVNKMSESGEVAVYSSEYYAAQKAKHQGLGLIKFLGELFKRQMLTERIMHKCFKKLLDNAENLLEEEDMESLCTLLTTIGSLLDNQKARARMDVYFQRMQVLCKNVNPRMQLMLQHEMLLLRLFLKQSPVTYHFDLAAL